MAQTQETSAALFAKAKEAEATAESLKREKWAATERLQAQIREIEGPYEKKISEANMRASTLRDQGYKAKKAEETARFTGKAPINMDEFKIWWESATENPFREEQFARYSGASEGIGAPYIYEFLKRNPNVEGLSVFGGQGEYYNYYVAFKGDKVFGYFAYHRSEHVGDDCRIKTATVKGKEYKDTAFDINNSGYQTSIVKPMAVFTGLLEKALEKA